MTERKKNYVRNKQKLIIITTKWIRKFVLPHINVRISNEIKLGSFVFNNKSYSDLD